MSALVPLVFVLILHSKNLDAESASTAVVPENAEIKLSEYINKILDHYKQDDPVGLPGAPIPDPLPIPPMNHSFTFGRMNLKDAQLYGLKTFRIDYMKINVADMNVEVALTFDTLNVIGNYTLNTWLSSAKGIFTVNLTKVYIKAFASLEVQRNGILEAQAISMDIAFKGISMDFKNLGFFATMFQGAMNSVGSFVFDSIKPYILTQVNSDVRSDINKQVSKIPQTFPNSISPFDQLVAEARRQVRILQYDPFKVPDYNTSVGVFDIYLSHSWLYGMSSFHRTKDILFELRNNTIHTILEVGTQKLLGSTHWDISLVAGIISKAGTASFSVEYLKVQINASQSMDTRKSPVLDDIQIELGNIQVRFDGLCTMDYIIEFGVNVLPNLIRYQIIDAIEKPIKIKIQDELNKVNIEELIKENSERLDNGGSLDFTDLIL